MTPELAEETLNMIVEKTGRECNSHSDIAKVSTHVYTNC